MISHFELISVDDSIVGIHAVRTMFNNLKFALIDFASTQRSLIVKNIVARSGNVYESKSVFFSGKANLEALPDDVTHILVRKSVVNLVQLKKSLNCGSISSSVHVVNENWYSACLGKNELVSEDEYRVQYTEPVSSSSSLSTHELNDGETSNKKQRFDDTYTSLVRPIIPYTSIKERYPDFNPVYGEWHEYKSIMYKFYDTRELVSSAACTGLVAFDMDWTLIKPIRGTGPNKVFGIDEFDWKFWDTSIVETLQRIYGEGKRLAIISNQQQIGQGKISKQVAQRKVDAIIEKIGVPIDYICSTNDDIFRKPLTGII